MVPILRFTLLLLLPCNILLVPLLNFLLAELVVEVVILLHAVVDVHKALIIDEELELLTVLREPQAVRSDHQLVLKGLSQ